MPTSIYTSKDKDHSEKPLKLMIKKHMLVGIKYLCKTVREDHNKYRGSGKYWKNILKKHGEEHVRTKLIFTTHSKSEFRRVGLLLSERWDIVDSNDWANLMPEGGEGGGVKGLKRTEEWKAKQSAAHKGKKKPPRTEEWKSKQSAAHKGKKKPPRTEEWKARIGNSNKGKKRSEETKAIISAGMKGKPKSEEAKARMSASSKRRKRDSNGRFI
jgi:hypothetical protein